MLKKTIKYIDFDGNEREEDFFFHISKAEATEMYFSESGGLDKLIEKIVKEKDNKKIFSIFKDVILKSFGEKSLDGKRFIKNPELTEAFYQSNAYEVLFMELVTNADAAAAFFNAIIPKENAK